MQDAGLSQGAEGRGRSSPARCGAAFSCGRVFPCGARAPGVRASVAAAPGSAGQRAALDSRASVTVAPGAAAAWHAGPSRTKD